MTTVQDWAVRQFDMLRRFEGQDHPLRVVSNVLDLAGLDSGPVREWAGQYWPEAGRLTALVGDGLALTMTWRRTSTGTFVGEANLTPHETENRDTDGDGA